MQPELASVTGSFEIFNPGIGSNIQWHTDGWTAGTYLAHYYPDQGGDADMDWFEVSVLEFTSLLFYQRVPMLHSSFPAVMLI